MSPARGGTRDRDAERVHLARWEGEPLAAWEALWGVPRFEAWSLLGSTNDRVRELARAGAPPFTVVTAEAQTAGRGRGGRSWASPAGLGLWVSILLRPPAAEAARLAPLLVGAAVCRAVERAAEGVCARLKWPNDVLLGERKVAGVLCEAAGAAVVAGVGINVAQRLADFPPELRERAVSLEMATGRGVGRAPLATVLVEEVRRLLSRSPLRIDGALAEEISRRDALRGKEVTVEGVGTGIARGIDAAGRLLVEVGGQDLRRVIAGSVTLLGGGPGQGHAGT